MIDPQNKLPKIVRYAGDSSPIVHTVTREDCDTGKQEVTSIHGWTFRMFISPVPRPTEETQIVTVDGTIDSATNGVVHFPYTMALPPNRQYLYSIQETDGDGNATTVGMGKISCKQKLSPIVVEV